jgi:Diguanylate cyclase, GGDEF domain
MIRTPARSDERQISHVAAANGRLCPSACTKEFNDHFGHQVGDRALIAIGRNLERARRTDRDIVARYGGEEFTMILPGASMEVAYKIADGIRLAASREEGTRGPTVSIGISTRVPDFPDAFDTIVTSGRRRPVRGKARGTESNGRRGRVDAGSLARYGRVIVNRVSILARRDAARDGANRRASAANDACLARLREVKPSHYSAVNLREASTEQLSILLQMLRAEVGTKAKCPTSALMVAIRGKADEPE